MGLLKGFVTLLISVHAVRNDETTIHSSELDLVGTENRSETEDIIIDTAVRLIRWGLDKGFANSHLPVPIQKFGTADCSQTHIGVFTNHMANCTFEEIVIGNPSFAKLGDVVDTTQKSNWTSDYMLKIRSIVIDVEFEGGFVFSSLTGVIIHQFKINGVDALYENVPKRQQATGSWFPWNWYEDVPGPGSNVKLAVSLMEANRAADNSDVKKRPPDAHTGPPTQDTTDEAGASPMPVLKIPDSTQVQINDIQLCYITSGNWQLHTTFNVPIAGILSLIQEAQAYKNPMPASVETLLEQVSINGGAPSLLSGEKRACRGAGGM
jgi:hypothetical protein